MTETIATDVIVIGAGGAGLMCALTAGRRGRRVHVIDHTKKIGEKIRISGGGRCNFTNLHTTPANFISRNPHFCVSALSRFGPEDFIGMVEQNGIKYHEKTLGQLFCDASSADIIDMLVSGCKNVGVRFMMENHVTGIKKTESTFTIHIGNEADGNIITCASLVIATGGLSIPKIGATDFGYRIARQFGLTIIEPRPGLVPFVFDEDFLSRYALLSGLSVRATVRCNEAEFTEALLFTHRGLSGPAILQASSYWQEGDVVRIDLSPDRDVFETLKTMKTEQPKMTIPNALTGMLPKRLAHLISRDNGVDGKLADAPDKSLRALSESIHDWRIIPSGTEGYKTAEVTVGGIDTNQLSSKTMECRFVPGLYFIGEVVDVTGHLGGFNFQWAWASGNAAGQDA